MTGQKSTGSNAIPSQMQRVLDALSGVTSAGVEKWEAFCPAHDDRQGRSLSLAVGDVRPVVAFCHAGCTILEVEDALKKTDRLVKVTNGGRLSASRGASSPKCAPKPEPRQPLPNDGMIRGWHERLKYSEPERQYLHARGISDETISYYSIGWNGRSYTLPVLDHRGVVVNLRTYDPNAKPKMRGLKGRGSQLYPVDVLAPPDLDDPNAAPWKANVVLCEGEWDALLLNQYGIPAVTGTAGAGTFKEEWAPKFKNKRVWITYDCDEEGRKGAQRAAHALNGHAKKVRVADLALPDDGADVTDWFVRYGRSARDFKALLTDAPLAKADPAAGADRTDDGFVLGSDVKVRPVLWLWKGYIPQRKITILEGNPSRFKTTISMDLIARVTKGKAMPGTKERNEPGAVLIVCAEDDPDDTLVPRLMAVDADLHRLAFYTVDRDANGQVVPLAIPDDLQELDRRIGRLTERTGLPVKLVVIDPITAYLGEGINSHNDASVRKALYPLGDLAGRREVAVLLVRHLNKDGSLQAEFRGGGSIAFTGASRSVLVVEKHPDEAGQYVLARVKNNLHAPVPGVVYEGIASMTYDAPEIRWLSHLDLDADTLLRGRDGRKAAPARKAAEAFLAEVLGGGPVKVPDLQALAKGAGISWRTVERAKDDMRLVVNGVRKEGGHLYDHWEWSLPYPTPPQTATNGTNGSQ